MVKPNKANRGNKNTEQICFFTGNMSSFNVKQTLLNIGNMLKEDFELHHVSTCPGSFPKNHGRIFQVFNTPNSNDTHLAAAATLRGYLSKYSPDIITQVGRVPVDGNLISILNNQNSKFVCRYSGDLFYEYKLESGLDRVKSFTVNNILGRLPIPNASKFITMGPRLKNSLVKRGVNSDNIGILPPPIDSHRFQISTEDRIDLPSDKLVLYVGRISRKKGAETLESTIPKVIRERNDIHFLLVGKKEYRFNFGNKIRENITLAGEVPPKEIPKFHQLADLYIHPSLTEGISRSLLEAIACDTTVITRDVGDQVYATSNYFTTDDEFVNMVVNHEELPKDNAKRFLLKNLKNKYIRFFNNV